MTEHAPGSDQGHVADGRVTVLISSSHPVLLDGIRIMLASDAGIKLVGEARSWSEAAAKTRQLRPDVLLVDLPADDEDAAGCIRRIKAANQSLTIVALWLSDAPASEEVFREAGVAESLSPQAGIRQLAQFLRGARVSRSGTGIAAAPADASNARPETRKIA